MRSWLEVVDSGGFARAADRVHLSQPRISAHVASLEHALGCTLIERRLRPLTLTDEGKRLLPRARSIVAAVDDTISDLRSTLTTVAGRVTVASFVSASSEFLPELLMRLRSVNPLIEVAVLDGDVQAIESALLDRRASVAIRPLRPEPADRALVVRPLWREPFVLLAPIGHPVLESKIVGLEQIAEYPVITIGDPLADQSVGYEAWSALLADRLEQPGGMVSHHPTTLVGMVRAGHGLGLLNFLAAAMARTDGLEVREIENRHLHRDVGVWWHSERPISRAAQALIDLAVASPRPAGTYAVPDGD
ncbi:MAG TPA: LysR family transcriptional regulator [Candidatus Limnocylindrales bacterium]|nr:LysR family transcriptional regulator [Candidatus Limnocylindrales bacterium]